jgi:hypothetical protein
LRETQVDFAEIGKGDGLAMTVHWLKEPTIVKCRAGAFGKIAALQADNKTFKQVKK